MTWILNRLVTIIGNELKVVIKGLRKAYLTKSNDVVLSDNCLGKTPLKNELTCPKNVGA